MHYPSAMYTHRPVASFAALLISLSLLASPALAGRHSTGRPVVQHAPAAARASDPAASAGPTALGTTRRATRANRGKPGKVRRTVRNVAIGFALAGGAIVGVGAVGAANEFGAASQASSEAQQIQMEAIQSGGGMSQEQATRHMELRQEQTAATGRAGGQILLAAGGVALGGPSAIVALVASFNPRRAIDRAGATMQQAQQISANLRQPPPPPQP